LPTNSRYEAPEIVVRYFDCERSYDELSGLPSQFPAHFGGLIAGETGLRGRVIDIGCGHGENPAYPLFADRIGQLDGVDPFPAVEPAARLSHRWTCRLEDLAVEDGSYDLAYSYNVIEHVKEIDAFLAKAVAILRPGGCYWALAPNHGHPFALLTRMLQRSGLPGIYRRLSAHPINDYPAWYRLSRAANVIESIQRQALPVRRIEFCYFADVKWRKYFPASLHWLPRAIDRGWSLRKPERSFAFAFRIEKAA
jgi:SAM-dependent methyltransferase